MGEPGDIIKKNVVSMVVVGALSGLAEAYGAIPLRCVWMTFCGTAGARSPAFFGSWNPSSHGAFAGAQGVQDVWRGSREERRRVKVLRRFDGARAARFFWTSPPGTPARLPSQIGAGCAALYAARKRKQ